MDLLSPKSLQDLCISVLAKKPNILWKQKPEKDGSVISEPTAVEWRDPKLFLHNQVADRLLENLGYNGTLGDRILSTFTSEHACLKNVKISDEESMTKVGLQVLSHHKLISLSIQFQFLCSNDICTVLECIGNKSNESLQCLVLQLQSKFWPRDDDLAGQSIVETLSRFNCLKRVDVSRTDLTDTMLTILGKSLLHVENLDLSWNSEITDISPLKNCQKTLKSLSLGGLPEMTVESAMATFMTLTGLTYLDVSLVTGVFFDARMELDSLSHKCGKNVLIANMLLEMPDALPNLVCLDLSGRTVRSEQTLSQFLDAHPSLQTLMLWNTAACQFKSLQDHRPRLTVGGDATLEQYAAVIRYWTTIQELKGLTFFCVQPCFVRSRLTKDLKTKHFPPCHDDQLVQAVLDIPARHRDPAHELLARSQVLSWLEIICLLLKKRDANHLEPGTMDRLLQLFRRIVGQSHVSGILDSA